MRQLLTERGGWTYCVAEFLRVSQDVPPRKVYFSHLPELIRPGCRTASGTPVQVQLLGGDPEKLAQSALRAVEAGAQAIDLNFGCPAPTVNRHDGGATLLKFPQRIWSIVRAVRQALPKSVPLSAKFRLGWDSMDPIHENTELAADAGVSWITIHGRTKAQGYSPPAYWGPIGEVKRRLVIPVIANGDIWSIQDLERCREETGCEHFMLGRGAMADPSLPLQAAKALGFSTFDDLEAWDVQDPLKWRSLAYRFIAICQSQGLGESYLSRRLKQWLKMSFLRNSQPWFDVVKRQVTVQGILCELERWRA